MTASRNVSLHSELFTLLSAIEGARILADELITEQFGAEHDLHQAPHAIAAILSLVQVRGTDLGRVIRREEDPWRFRAAHNATSTTLPEDVTFPSWTPEQRREKAERDLRNAERDIRPRPRRKKNKKK